MEKQEIQDRLARTALEVATGLGDLAESIRGYAAELNAAVERLAEIDPKLHDRLWVLED